MSLPITDRNEATGGRAEDGGDGRESSRWPSASACWALPGTASAAPSDDELGAVTAAADDVAAQVSQLLEQMGAAQAAAEDATARAASAQAEVDAMQRAAAAARVAAEAAAAEAQRAETDLAGARDAVARFARSSYMSGSSSPLLESLLTSSGPAQIVERAALLDAAGSYRSTAVSAASTARERAVETQTDAQSARDGGRPPAGRSAGRTRLGGGGQDRRNAGGGRSPGPAERCCRTSSSGADHAGGPAGAAGRSAPRRPGRRPRRRHPPAEDRSGRQLRRPLPRLTTGTRSPSASPVATGASTPATATTAACSSARRPGWRSAAAPTRRAPTWPRKSQQIAVAEKVLAAQGPGAWPTCGRNL